MKTYSVTRATIWKFRVNPIFASFEDQSTNSLAYSFTHKPWEQRRRTAWTHHLILNHRHDHSDHTGRYALRDAAKFHQLVSNAGFLARSHFSFPSSRVFAAEASPWKRSYICLASSAPPKEGKSNVRFTEMRKRQEDGHFLRTFTSALNKWLLIPSPVCKSHREGGCPRRRCSLTYLQTPRWKAG